MARVPVTVNGRRYDIGCDDGQENDVRRLAADLDRRVASMAASVGQVGDSRLLVMTGLLMAHELEQRQSAADSAADSAPAAAQAPDMGEPGTGAPDAGAPHAQSLIAGEEDEALCQWLESLAARVEVIAQKFAPGDGEPADEPTAAAAEETAGIAARTESS